MGSLGDQSCEYQAEADDEPRQGIEVLAAARARGRVPAGGSRPLPLYVCDPEQRKACARDEAKC
jgi:hypothetical protein